MQHDNRKPWSKVRLLATVAGSMLLLAASPATALSTHPGTHTSQHAAPQRGQGYLGIEFHDVPDEQATAFHLKAPQRGAEIVMIDHDGPAGKAGLRQHDIVLALNGQAVDSAVTLRRLIHDAGAGASIRLAIVRAGKPLTVAARLASREDVERDAMQKLAAGTDIAPPTDPMPGVARSFATPGDPGSYQPPSKTQQFLNAMLHTGPFTGLEMETMPPQLAGYFGAGKDIGLLVSTVVANSPAAVAGIRAGDVLVRADNAPLHTTGDWLRRLRAAKGRPVTVTFLRDHHEFTVTLLPDPKRHSALSRRDVWPEQVPLTA